MQKSCYWRRRSGRADQPAPTRTVATIMANLMLRFVAALCVSGPLTDAKAQNLTVRDPCRQPGGSHSAWNTPFGDGAIWGNTTDPDTIDIARGWDLVRHHFTPGPFGVINEPKHFGVTLYVGSKPDHQYQFITRNNGRAGNRTDNGSILVARLHLPSGARSGGPYPGDNPIIILDPIEHPGRMFTFDGVDMRDLKPGQGPFTAHAGEWDDIHPMSLGRTTTPAMPASMSARELSISAIPTPPAIQTSQG
jgi:hypothetical protein